MGALMGASSTKGFFPILVKEGAVDYPADSLGNRQLDYSACGYRHSEAPLPSAKNTVYVSALPGDNYERIQRAIDYVSSLPVAADGLRGAVLLGPGTFDISKPLRIAASGVVVRGSGVKSTTLIKKGVDRGAAIYIEGSGAMRVADTTAITSPYVALRSRSFTVASTRGLKNGDRVVIERPCSKEWIESLGCDIFGGGISALGWKPGDVTLRWDRTITAIEGDTVTIDHPLAMALRRDMGEASLMAYTWPGRIDDSGVEYLTLLSDYDRRYPKDEDHAWDGISISNAEDCWVRSVDFRHFAGSAVILQSSASRCTVEDCRATDPVSEIGGMRRRVFLTLGQHNLFQRCYSKNGINDFSAGMYAAGPNAFVQCDADETLGFSGASDAWAPGLLFDIVNIDGGDISLKNLGQDKNGAGWNTGNSLVWQSTAAGIDCYSPAPDAWNTAYGCWSQFSGDGYWDQSNNHVSPRSIFYSQLTDRLGSEVSDRQSRILPRETNATSSPTVEKAMARAKEAYIPRLTLEAWIEEAPVEVSFSPDGVKSIDDIKAKDVKRQEQAPAFEIKGGVMTTDGAAMRGGRLEVPWWNGKIKPSTAAKAKPHVTRFVPGLENQGLTDRIDSTLAAMKRQDILVLDHNYGLWYERRRDDHERVRRRDGDVWAPFYEQPFARSGEGTAWDGLSRYDLTRPNAWYWSRLNEYASKAAPEGRLLFNEHYFQHNILEAGAHWVDSPWRSANNINDTGFPEPVPFAGDKRIFMAELFYDTIHPQRKELHRNFIRMNLEELADNPNVVHLISAEYTGPLHFTQFWLDVIGEWERETGRDVKVALSTTKDVQDSILADPRRAALVDIIDIRYWHYKTDGTYAPEGGRNLAPRQHARKMKVGKVSFDDAYRAVSEYRTKYPDKAVTYYAQNYPDMAWAVFMGGGSLSGIPVTDPFFLAASAEMIPVDRGSNPWTILRGASGCIVYTTEAADVPLDLPEGKYRITRYDLKTGEPHVVSKSLRLGASSAVALPEAGAYWIENLGKK